jgi:predicted small integral membrane protein
MIIRLCKISLVAALALFFTLVAFGNVTDYGTNEEFVRHVFSMDTFFETSNLRWRAITNPNLQTAGYWLIIATQIIAAVVLWIGGMRLVRELNSNGFDQAKRIAAAGLTLGFLLYAVGFILIGGEWFAKWQSPTWNGQQTAFGFLAMIGVALIVLLIPDGDAPA